MSRILAIDHGSVRIGLAISDQLRMFAKPLKTIANKGFKPVLKELEQIIREQDVGLIILGMPWAIDGSDTPKTLEVKAFGEKLKKQIEIELIVWDERYSSAEADEELSKLRYDHKRKKELRDAMAAAMILKSYLERDGI